MKKLSFVLALVLVLLGCVPAFASDVYSEPITFRGIPWASTLQEVRDGLDGADIHPSMDFNFWCPMIDHLYQTAQMSDNYVKGEVGFLIIASNSAFGNLKVAGYEPSVINLWFVYTADETGALAKNAAHSAFYSADYEIDPADPEFAYNDLTEKLTSLYGDIDFERQEKSIINYTQRVWYGADGTMVSLTKEDYNSGSCYIHIGYGAESGFDLVKDAVAASKVAERNSVGSSTDGL